MSEPIVTIEAARTALSLKCAPTTTPELTTDEGGDLDAILSGNVHATVWTPATKYKLGARIIPTEDNRNGRMFKCVRSGTSGDTDEDEPVWADFEGWITGATLGLVTGNLGSSVACISDGDVQWVDDGVECDLWNIDDAAHDAWMVKSTRASDIHNIIRGGNSYDFEAVYRHCREMANSFGGAFIR